MPSQFVASGLCERIGKRPTMEDAISIIPQLCTSSFDESQLPLNNWKRKPTPPTSPNKEREKDKKEGFFGVFDGHGGRESASFCSSMLPFLLCQNPERACNPQSALKESFLECDELLRDHLQSRFADSPEYNSGCTAVAVYITQESHCTDDHETVESKKTKKLFCANVGDSRCIVVKRDGGFVEMSEDHVPGLEREKKRIEDAGGFISSPQYGSTQERVLGALAVTRALGDFEFKMPKVSSWGTSASPIDKDLVDGTPEIREHRCEEDDLAVVLACDGIWNVFSSQEAAEFVASRFQKLDGMMKNAPANTKCELVATALVEIALERGSNDNCSCIVLMLSPEERHGLLKNVSATCSIS